MTQSERPFTANLTQHRRIVHPTPVGSQWKMECTCGHTFVYKHKALTPMRAKKVQDTLNQMFIEHVPEDERCQYVLIDQRAGHEGNWLMPEGTPCQLGEWQGSRGMGFVIDVISPKLGTMPVGEIRTVEGHTLIAD